MKAQFYEGMKGKKKVLRVRAGVPDSMIDRVATDDDKEKYAAAWSAYCWNNGEREASEKERAAENS